MRRSLTLPGGPRTLWPLLVVLLVLTGVGVSLSAGTPVRLAPASTPAPGLSVDEATYYEYVAPRLQRLVGEMDSVVALVKERSRNVIALNAHGNRITTLADEIRAYGESHPIPPRFAAVHQEILGGTERASTAMSDARRALQRFDFTGIPKLIPEFEDGAAMLRQALDALRASVGATPEARPTG